MREKPYYSIRTGKHPLGARFTLPMLRRMFAALFADFDQRDFFRELLGYECVDAGFVAGTAGKDVDAFLLRNLKKDSLWPISQQIQHYSEDDVFDLIELLYDHVSHPSDGEFHSYGGCGWHYHTFDREKGQLAFRAEVNGILREYMQGFELSVEGEILTLPDTLIATLLETKLPALDPQNIEGRVKSAAAKFRSRHASDRRDAIRDLADVLEYLRPKLKGVLVDKDEQDLFNIVNNFEIRHHNQKQKTHYDTAIWYSWMFHFYLATIHAVARLVAKAEAGTGGARSTGLHGSEQVAPPRDGARGYVVVPRGARPGPDS